jgi:membrane-bound inhibitor of C-type lysozyme
MAKTNGGGSGWVKYLLIFNLLGLLMLFILVAHLVKTVKNMAVNEANTTAINSVEYKCDADKTINAVFFQDKAELNLSDGRSLLLMQGMSADGVRYTNGDESITFWTKGNTSLITQGPNDTETYANCNQTASN